MSSNARPTPPIGSNDAPPQGSSRLPRRDFLKGTAAVAAASVLPTRFAIARRAVNDEIRVAVIGFNGRGSGLINEFRSLPGVRVVALCDADQAVLDREMSVFAKRGEKVDGTRDLRSIMDRDDVDVVVTATPNHWHALITIWACQSGKDVYVEKPVSHNVWEGRQMVAAARKYGRIVQTGTQSRSSDGLKEAAAWVKEGHHGAVTLSRGFCYKPRQSIGRVSGPQEAPSSVDYDLWTGPAPRVPLARQRLHYDWHWDFATGCGDLGNQGIHQMDLARWFAGHDALSPRVAAIGGRFGYVDDADTPNTLLVYHDYPTAPLLFEVRGLPRDKAAQGENWGGSMDQFKGVQIGVVVECEGGEVRIPNYSTAIVLDRAGKEVRRFEGPNKHAADFIAAVRSRRSEDLAADILEGHISSALCHTGNISYRVGRGMDRDAVSQTFSDGPGKEATERMLTHLEKNEVDVAKSLVTVGPWLNFDVAAEQFVDNPEGGDAANQLLTREYRAPFVVPEAV